jgi:hypothetical protein
VKATMVEAYKNTVDILMEYYLKTDRYYDQLGAMIDDMEYKSWKPLENEPLVSGDPGIFLDDLTNAWNTIVGKDKEGTPEQVFMVAKTILDYYTNEVEYELGDAESYLKEHLGA